MGASIADTSFVSSLLHAVPDRVSLAGWRITGRGDGVVLLEGDGVRACLQVTSDAEDTLDPVAFDLSTPALVPGLSPGFVVRRGQSPIGDLALTRIYINLNYRGAIWALGCLAVHLDSMGRRRDESCSPPSSAYLRRDSCVVYVPTAELGRALELILACSKQRDMHSKQVPLLVKRVAPGIGFADEPTDISGALSHGQWVMDLFLRGERSEPGSNRYCAVCPNRNQTLG